MEHMARVYLDTSFVSACVTTRDDPAAHHHPGSSLGDTMSEQPTKRHPDPCSEEVHRLKRQAFERSGNDLKRHFDRLKEIEKAHPGGVVPPPQERKGGAA